MEAPTPPPPAPVRGPRRRRGHWLWEAGEGGLEIRFVGRGPEGSRAEVLRSICDEPPPLAWLDQVHSALAVPARPGPCGRADALFTAERGLALSLVTADCLPLVAATGDFVTAMHAGWRGLAAGLVTATLARLDPRRRQAMSVWLGPAIGPCCYEVGPEVAAQVAAASSPGVVVAGTRGRPHLDLAAAARAQLAAAGVTRVVTVRACTRCDPRRLWSYRRDGRAAGRNHAFAWLRSPDPPG